MKKLNSLFSHIFTGLALFLGGIMLVVLMLSAYHLAYLPIKNQLLP